MAPPTATAPIEHSLDSTSTKKANTLADLKAAHKKPTSAYEITELYKKLIDTEFKAQDEVPGHYKYDYLRPSFPDYTEPPLELQSYDDAALRADPSYPNLLKAVSDIEHLTPNIGTVLHGIKLGELNDAARDELALLVANRQVVFVRDQQDFDIKDQLALGRHWGKLHRHATTSVPKGAAEDPELRDVHVIWGDESRVPGTAFPQTYLWHSDVTYEKQPPSYTSLKLLQGPETGGDTQWTSGYAVYDQLSPYLQKYLEKLSAYHSAQQQADDSRRSGRVVRREPVVSRHPLVRTNPVTGHKSVFVNSGFVRAIADVPTVESEHILKLLNEIIATDVANTVRWKWREGDIAIWDNRSTVHTASWGFYPHRRHAVRVTVTGEKPTFDPSGTSQQEELDKKLGIKSLNKDGTAGGNYND